MQPLEIYPCQKGTKQQDLLCTSTVHARKTYPGQKLWDNLQEKLQCNCKAVFPLSPHSMMICRLVYYYSDDSHCRVEGGG